MILHVDIRDFAIIKELSLDLHDGLNILTGETGAGKSIIIEAVSMALGSRADTEYIRTGAEKASVTLVIDPEDNDISGLLEEMGASDDTPVVLMRELSRSGRNVCRVNGSIVPLSSMNRLGKRLADIHGQYDHQSLLDPDRHIDMLDLYGGTDLTDLRSKVKEYYDAYTSASAELMQLRKRISDSARQKELLRFELNEIESAGLYAGEDEELEEQLAVMKNSEKIFSAVSEARETVFERDGSALEQLSYAVSGLESVSEYSKEIAKICETLNDAYYQIEDLNSSMRHILDSVEYSEEELNIKTERLEAVNALKRRFGGSIEAVLAYASEAAESLRSIENSDERIAELEREISLQREYFDASAARLSKLRKQVAAELEKRISKELSELNFGNSDFRVSFESAPVSAKGTDRVEFLMSTNRGEPPRPLAKIASGGELSRIMLAMKRIIGEYDSIPTMIFDEIDSGISGSAAGVVGNKLLSIADGRQIICITHLPQIASKGRHHYRIEKLSDEISTHTTVTPLSDDERVEEIARLLSGTEITDSARAQAKELLNC
ncbi:MAG: DNA repair protein RecN [Firmicutes bacterium]|nr:DNA repair protein RecN [Bacillota bacterium]